jgi:hypothetical protein
MSRDLCLLLAAAGFSFISRIFWAESNKFEYREGLKLAGEYARKTVAVSYG